MADGAQRAEPGHQGEQIAALSAILLLVLMFALKWFGLATTPSPSATRSAVSSAENAWNGMPIVRWVMLVTIIVALGAPLLHATQRTHGTVTDTGRIVFALGILTALLLFYRVLIDLPSSRDVVDQKVGAYLGLLAGVGIVLGGFESLRADRARARRVRQHARREPVAPRRVRSD